MFSMLHHGVTPREAASMNHFFASALESDWWNLDNQAEVAESMLRKTWSCDSRGLFRFPRPPAKAEASCAANTAASGEAVMVAETSISRAPARAVSSRTRLRVRGSSTALKATVDTQCSQNEPLGRKQLQHTSHRGTRFGAVHR